MASSSQPLPPKGTHLRGKALWSAVLDRYELEQQELALLREIVRSVDELDDLSAAVSRHGVVTPGGGLNPAVAEARQLRVALASLVASLRLPAGGEADDRESSLRRPRRYAPVRSIDPPAPRRDAAARVSRTAAERPSAPVTPGRHAVDGRSGNRVALSVAELCAKAAGRPSAAASA